MTQTFPRTSVFRALVIAVMACLILAFTSAEVRARMMVHMAEEQGVGRFYEDKATHRQPEATRFAHMQHGRQRVELPLRVHAAGHSHHRQAPVVGALGVARRRHSTHGPRAPPRNA
jgi:hypothetical protein